MPSGYFRSAFTKSESKPVEEDKDKMQRFTDDTLGKPIRSTAKRHSFSPSLGLERQDSGHGSIPGAFPLVQKKKWFELEQLPTTEHPSGSRVGVGSLPGNISESSVALLPEEREHPDPYLNGNIRPQGRRPQGRDPLVGGVDESKRTKASTPKAKARHYEAKKALEVDKSELPTLERPSGSKAGVGSLPGSNYEVGVAVLPEERLHPDPIVGDVGLANFSQPKHKFYKRNKHLNLGGGQRESELPTQEYPSGSRVGLGSIPGDIHEAGVATLPEERVEVRTYGTRNTQFEDHDNDERPSRKNKTRPAQRSATYPLKTKTKSKPKSEYELPTTEEPSTSRVGIGSMPGSIYEAGVATLPEERIDGRPYGSGHTGFEDTLGHGHTFRPTHLTGEDTFKSKSKSQSKSKTTQTPGTAQIVVDAAAKQYLMEQNPISIASSRSHETSNTNLVSSRGEDKLSGDTIFSATQDLCSAHGKRNSGERSEERPEAPPWTEGHSGTSDASTEVRRGPTVAAQARPQYTGPSVLETVEGAALGAMHGAENMFYRVGDSAWAYVPEFRLPRLVGFGGSSSGGDASQRSVVSNSEHPVDSYSAPSRGENLSLDPTLHRLDASALPEDKDITDAIQSNTTISGRESQLSQVIQSEYYRRPEKDSENDRKLFGDRLDFNQFMYDDDDSYKAPSIPSSVTIPNEHRQGRFSDLDTEKDNLQYGRNGVAFSMAPGQDGTLPGYPTQEGMNKLIGERLRDDHLRATGAKNPFKSQSSTSSKAVEPPVSGIAISNVFDHYAMSECHTPEKQETPIVAGVKPMAADKYEEVFRNEPEESSLIETDISRRNLREKREVPIFKGGKSAASGVYEAVFREEELLPVQFDDSRHTAQETRGIPVIKSGKPTAAGKYEAVYRNEGSLPLESDISPHNLGERREVPFFTSGNREQESVFRNKELLITQPDSSNRGAIEDRENLDFESAEPIAASDFEAAYRDTLRDDKFHVLDSDQSKKEKREASVFKSGKPIAPGEYESAFNDESLLADARISNRYLEEKRKLSSVKESPTASGKLEWMYRDEDLPPPRSSKTGNMNPRIPDTPQPPQQQSKVTTPSTKGGSGFAVGFLGKAISPEQEVIETERARKAAIRRMGIN